MKLSAWSSVDQRGGVAGLCGTALDVLQHQHQAQRDGDVDWVGAGGCLLKLRGDVAPGRPLPLCRWQVPHERAHVGEKS